MANNIFSQSAEHLDWFYSTPNSQWSPIDTYVSGSIIEMRFIINNNHWVSDPVSACEGEGTSKRWYKIAPPPYGPIFQEM